MQNNCDEKLNLHEIFDVSDCSLENIRYYDGIQPSTVGMRFKLILSDAEDIGNASLQKANLICELMEFLVAKQTPQTLILPKLRVFQESTTFNDDHGRVYGQASFSVINLPKYKITDEKRILDNYLHYSEEAVFALDAFDMSLNTSNPEMRFYALFCIIEKVEKTYKEYRGAQRRYSVEEIEKLNELCGQINKKLFEDIKGAVGKLTDIGRAECLLNILKYMNVVSYTIDSNSTMIDKECISRLIQDRNYLFHGEKINMEFKKDLRILHSICLNIINYLLEESITAREK